MNLWVVSRRNIGKCQKCFYGFLESNYNGFLESNYFHLVSLCLLAEEQSVAAESNTGYFCDPVTKRRNKVWLSTET